MKTSSTRDLASICAPHRVNSGYSSRKAPERRRDDHNRRAAGQDGGYCNVLNLPLCCTQLVGYVGMQVLLLGRLSGAPRANEEGPSFPAGRHRWPAAARSCISLPVRLATSPNRQLHGKHHSIFNPLRPTTQLEAPLETGQTDRFLASQIPGTVSPHCGSSPPQVYLALPAAARIFLRTKPSQLRRFCPANSLEWPPQHSDNNPQRNQHRLPAR